MHLFNKEARTAGATQGVARGRTQTPETRPRREPVAIAETPLPRGLVTLVSVAVLCLLLLSIQATQAHREHGVWTELIWREDHFEITHHMHLQDAHAILAALKVDSSLDSPEGLAHLALYVEDRFLLSEDGKPVRLDLIGAEAEGDFLYVFQEWHRARPTALPDIKSTLLTDVHPNAVTWIHVEAPGFNQTWAVGDHNSNG